MQYAENIHQMTCKLLHVVNHYGDKCERYDWKSKG